MTCSLLHSSRGSHRFKGLCDECIDICIKCGQKSQNSKRKAGHSSTNWEERKFIPYPRRKQIYPRVIFHVHSDCLILAENSTIVVCAFGEEVIRLAVRDDNSRMLLRRYRDIIEYVEALIFNLLKKVGTGLLFEGQLNTNLVTYVAHGKGQTALLKCWSGLWCQ